MGQKKVNKANDAFGLKKSREQSNQTNNNNFSYQYANRPKNTALLNAFLEQVKGKNKDA